MSIDASKIWIQKIGLSDSSLCYLQIHLNEILTLTTPAMDENLYNEMELNFELILKIFINHRGYYYKFSEKLVEFSKKQTQLKISFSKEENFEEDQAQIIILFHQFNEILTITLKEMVEMLNQLLN